MANDLNDATMDEIDEDEFSEYEDSDDIFDTVALLMDFGKLDVDVNSSTGNNDSDLVHGDEDEVAHGHTENSTAEKPARKKPDLMVPPLAVEKTSAPGAQQQRDQIESRGPADVEIANRILRMTGSRIEAQSSLVNEREHRGTQRQSKPLQRDILLPGPSSLSQSGSAPSSESSLVPVEDPSRK